MTRVRWRTGAAPVAILVAISTGCDRQIAAPTVRPRPELASPEVARVIQASGRTGPVAVSRAADPRTGQLGPYEVVTDAQARARLERISALGSRVSSDSVGAMDFGGPWYVIQPGGLRVAKGQWNNVRMHRADNKRWATWEFYCAAGSVTRVNKAHVDSLWNTAVVNTGAHGGAHPLASKPVQEHWKTSGLSDANLVFVDTIWGNVASGDEVYRMAWTDSMPGSACFGLSKTEVQTVATRYLECCMTPLTAQSYLRFATVTSDHTYPFYATPTVVSRTYVAARYINDLVGEQTEIEAGSLIYGGLNDVGRDWTINSGHATHRTGTDMDFDTSVDTQARWDRMIRAGVRAGFRLCQVHNRNHVHCFDRLYS